VLSSGAVCSIDWSGASLTHGNTISSYVRLRGSTCVWHSIIGYYALEISLCLDSTRPTQPVG